MKMILSAALLLGLCGPVSAQGTKANPVGKWNCEYEINDMKRTSTVEIKKDGDKLAGTLTWQDKKESKLQDVKFKDGELSFSADREIQESKINIRFKLKIDGDTCKGKLEADVGGETRSIDIEGKRETKKKDK